MTWLTIRDGHPQALTLYQRHYSCYHYADHRRRRRFIGPGARLVLITPDFLALFAWRKFIDHSGQTGVNCAVFRNEGPKLSSDVIRAAEVLAWAKWPGARLYTYVAPRKIKSTNPGFCFLMAGWRRCGITRKRRYLILEKLPQ